MARRKVKALPRSDWPREDQNALAAYIEALCKDQESAKRNASMDDLFKAAQGASFSEITALFTKKGTSHGASTNGDHYMRRVLAGSTMAQVERSYGYWLAYLEQHYPAALHEPLHTRLTFDRLEGFVRSLSETREPSSIALTLVQMRMLLVRLSPTCNFGYLKNCAKFWAMKKLDASTKTDLVLADKVFSLGQKMMRQALERLHEDPVRPGQRMDLGIRTMYRDGLILAILAICPLRRSNLAGLQLVDFSEKDAGARKPLVLADHGRCFVIRADRSVVKNDVSLWFELPESLSPFLRIYIKMIRPEYPGADTHQGLFCSSRRRAPLAPTSINLATKRTTKAAGKASQTPRDIRRGAVTYWAIHDPLNLERCRHLLGHKKASRTLNKAYNQVRSTRYAAKSLFVDVMAFLQEEPWKIDPIMDLSGENGCDKAVLPQSVRTLAASSRREVTDS